MYMVHTVLRREFALLPALVRGVAVDDKKRSAIVSDHIELLATMLRAHHHSEDVCLWPKLLERGSEEVVAIVHAMEVQHAGIEKIDAEVTATTMVWRDDPVADSGVPLADALSQLDVAINEHMSMEEQRILPLVEKYVTLAEWEEMVGVAGHGLPQEKIPLVFGMTMYEGDPDVVRTTLSRLPPELRATLEELGPGAFASHSELVHGTATPARGKG
jgi:hemerythrin-like domain-containing protein